MTLDHQDWAYWVVAPVLAGDLAVIGDVEQFVPAGDARIEVSVTEHPDGPAEVNVVVKGAGETVTVTGWSAGAPTARQGTEALAVTHDSATGVWRVTVTVGRRGWTTITLRPTS